MDAALSALRIGAVPYLNAQPLITRIPAAIQLFSPRELVDRLIRWELEVALVPTIAAAHMPNLWWVPEIAILSKGAVKSVIANHRCPLDQVKTLAVDHDSRTSVLLARIIFEIFRRQPLSLLPEGDPCADAQLWIGDRALRFRAENPQAPLLDLGEAWDQHTSLPFVYAAWAVSPHVSPDHRKLVASILIQAAKEGLDQRELLAHNDQEKEYLHKHIRYTLDQEAIEGWRYFLKLATTLQNQTSPPTLNFI
ncbi:MAG: menaquinone biosynthesis protein [Methylacidiphilales bacterium]|nr:menaquinone biosynthesis protein [Candidatus Methylacidiphilales bacterium]MDW8349504.1 menaquinone biosynthesis protein [Verrucomicrobiae bacterium]